MFANQSDSQQKVCKLPMLRLTGHDNLEKYVACKMKEEWGYLATGRWHLNKTVTSRWLHKNINCTYRNLTRSGNDFELSYSDFAKLDDGQIVSNDVIEVNCVLANENKTSFNNLYVQIVDKYESLKKSLVNNNNDRNESSEQRKSCEPMNILLLSYDSLSRVSWFKRLPQTTEYMLDEMKFDLLYGFNILGDGYYKLICYI
jgi:hypothetical protein